MNLTLGCDVCGLIRTLKKMETKGGMLLFVCTWCLMDLRKNLSPYKGEGG